MLGRCLLVLSLLAVACTDAPATPSHSNEGKEDAGRAASAEDDPLADLEERAFPLLVWSSYRVEQEYFDPDRFAPREQLLTAAEFLGLHTPEFFAEVDPAQDLLRVKVRARTATFPLGDVLTLRAASDRLEEILVFTQEVLDLEPEPLHELEYAAINGLFAPLDPHTVLLSPEEHNDLGVRTRGHFGGIGAQIRAEARRILVVRVLPGMPAEKAGMKAGDVILTIDGAATVNMPAEEAQSLLRGPVGEEVVVVVRRGAETLRLPITRDTIHVDSVEAAMLPGNIAYLSISTFQENTAEQLEQKLQALGGESGPAGVVIDLRGNSGGLLTQATEVVDTLVSQGELVIVRSVMGREVEEAQEAMAVPAATPVVVLVDEDSASAAEIVAGGLEALGRGVVLGRDSFGKGTVQMVKPASPYGRELALKLTVAEYLVAGDHRIQSLGVVPDVELLPVEMSGIPGIARYYDAERFERQRERSRTAHLPSSKHDPQLPPDFGAGATLRYLWTAEVPGELREQTDDLEVLDRLQDPEIRIAREVALGLAGASDAEQRADALEQVTRRLASEEDGRIVEALAEAKVDWRDDPALSSPPSLAVRMSRSAEAPVHAGQPFVVHVEVDNRGTEAVERVHGITDCVHDELDGIEVMLGRIDPGETVKRDLELHVMPWHSDFTDLLAIDVHTGEPDDTPDARAELRLEVEGAERPALAYDWWIVDDPSLVDAAPTRPEAPPLPEGEKPFTVAGNGDGMLQPGERVLLAFVARNEGPGVSPDVRGVLHNHSAAQGLLEEGAVSLGELKPGARAAAAFGITVNPDADPGLPFEVELLVGDAQIRARAGDELRLRILPDAPKYAADARRVSVGSEPLRVYNGAHASAPVVVELPEGAEVPTVGTVGAWRVIEEPKVGRRVFVPADLGKAIAAGSGKPPAHPLAAVDPPPLVLPPGLSLEGVPRVVSRDHVTLRGTATHPRRIRDVAVLVHPPGISTLDHKVHYAANPEVKGAAAQSLSFEAEVPLEPGGNRITILARDGHKVELREDVWVFREP